MADLFQDETEIFTRNAARVAVLIPYPVDKPYDYLVPEGMQVQDGDYVIVPLGAREVVGVVWGEGAGDIPAKKCKSVLARFDAAPMTRETRDFIGWVARYTLSPLGSVLKMAISVPAALEPPLTTTLYQRNPKVSDPKNLSSKQEKVWEVLGNELMVQADLARAAGVSAGVVKTLADKNILVTVERATPSPCRNADPDHAPVSLSEAQRRSAEYLIKALSAKTGVPILLDGVTGAGKTEVYFEAVAACMRMEKQVLILMPEIALSNAFIDRFAKRFGCRPALWHSSLTSAQRRVTWRGVAEGEVQVIVGARSSLFLPFADLGLIIVDESHDASYKQEEGVIYHARDMAIVRGALTKIPVVLASATPALETMLNVWEKKYGHAHLPSRHGGATMPDISVIDLREDKPARQAFLSPVLIEAIRETMDKGSQSLLFLNRRGYAPLTLCRTCGHRFECPRCTSWLVEHRASNALACHHCGYQIKVPDTCPECDDTDSLAPCGPGVERIEEEVKLAFPDAKVMTLSSDMSEDQTALRAALDQIRDHKIDIVVGTQIIAKGHHFPKLELVGVVDADLGLHGGDLRAAERSYQLLHQVAGRAGREKGAQGRVYLQSWNPAARVIQALASGDRDTFLEAEAEERSAAHMPPYSRLAAIIVSSPKEMEASDIARKLAATAPNGPGVMTYGPAPAPLYRIRGKYRFRLLVHAEKQLNIQKSIAQWLASHKIPSTARVQVDIDPQSFL